MSASALRLDARGIGKSFAGVPVLADVDLSLEPGEILALVGANGAGKSTLMRILAGVERADTGVVEVDGHAVRPGSVRHARAAGIALIHQELVLAGNLDVASNVFLGREPRTGPFVDRRRLHADASVIVRRLGLDVPTVTRVDDLSLGRRQLVEIARALAADARVLIMDEPTSSLSPAEVRRLFDVVRELSARGVSVVLISHRLAEVCALATRAVVLRDGRIAGTLRGADVGRDALLRLMVGRDPARRASRVRSGGEALLDVSDLVTGAHGAASVSFRVHAGEIVALAGLAGAGRSELLSALFGIVPARAGRIAVAGRVVSVRRPRDAVATRMALVPEERQAMGLLPATSVRGNLALPCLLRDARGRVFVDARAEAALSARWMRDLDIRAAHDGVPATALSGGNQQKVVLGKWLATDPLVLLLDEPTRGVDVGGKDEIHGRIEALAARGVAVLFASSEMEEILGLADRVLVLHEGRLAGELHGDAASEEAILRLAIGGGLPA